MRRGSGKAGLIREYWSVNPGKTDAEVAEALATHGVTIQYIQKTRCVDNIGRKGTRATSALTVTTPPASKATSINRLIRKIKSDFASVRASMNNLPDRPSEQVWGRTESYLSHFITQLKHLRDSE